MDTQLARFLLKLLGVEYAWFDARLRLQWHSPRLSAWLWEPAAGERGAFVCEVFPEFVGNEAYLAAILRGEAAPLSIPRIHRPETGQRPAYLTLAAYPYAEGLLVLARDVSEEGALEQRITQTRNELHLLSETLRQSSARLDTLIRRFVPSAAVDEMLRDESKALPGGERREITVVFADLRDYTQWAEKRPPETVLAMLNHLWSMVLAEAAECGGTVNQFMGDGVMLMFNAPRTQPDHARRALECARKLAALAPPEPALRFGVGVNSGPVVVGNVGGRERLSYTAIGTTTNVAHRLQALARPGQVIFGQRTRLLAGDEVRCTPLEPVSVKGLSAPLQIFELLP